MAELIDLTLRVMRDEPGDQAVLMAREDGSRVWLPRSLIEIEYKDAHHRTAEITLPVWLAEDKGLT